MPTPSPATRTLLLTLLGCLLVAGAFWIIQGITAPSPYAPAPEGAQQALLPIQKPTAAQLHALRPDWKGQPVVVDFYSKTCLDCQRLAPRVKAAMAKVPGVTLVPYDVAADRDRQPGLFNLFDPQVVPVLVLIDAQGIIRQVVTEVVPEAELVKSFQALSSPKT